MLAACGGSDDSSTTPTQAALSCDDSIKTSFKPDDQTTVLAVKQMRKGDQVPISFFSMGFTPLSADVCMVKLLVGPGNPGTAGAPSTSAGIGIEVWLPAKDVWTGRLTAVGNGGWGGSEESNPDKLSRGNTTFDWRTAAMMAADSGDVTANSDMGHRWSSWGQGQVGATELSAGSDGSFGLNPDGTVNKVGMEDFSERSVQMQVLKAKALAQAYYGNAPTYTYWSGTSTGGRQGLKAAQKFPDLFDGILAGVPAINWSKMMIGGVYPGVVVQRDLGGVPMSSSQTQLVATAAIAACDMVGGQHLGMILDPSSCRYNPTTDLNVLCTGDGGTNATPACLSKAQASVVNKIWYGMTSDGSAPAPDVDNGWPPVLGGNHLAFGAAKEAPIPQSSLGLWDSYLAIVLQNSFIASPPFTNALGNGASGWKAMSYSQLAAALDRAVALQPVLGNINTDDSDLSAFKASGGKLIVLSGNADALIVTQGHVNYYERVLAKMGGADSVQSFFRYSPIPAMGHGPTNGSVDQALNPPLPAVGQYYKLMTDWVEKGITPDNVVHVSASATPVQKSLPVCWWPKKITYVSGNINLASSYKCS